MPVKRRSSKTGAFFGGGRSASTNSRRGSSTCIRPFITVEATGFNNQHGRADPQGLPRSAAWCGWKWTGPRINHLEYLGPDSNNSNMQFTHIKSKYAIIKNLRVIRVIRIRIRVRRFRYAWYAWYAWFLIHMIYLFTHEILFTHDTLFTRDTHIKIFTLDMRQTIGYACYA